MYASQSRGVLCALVGLLLLAASAASGEIPEPSASVSPDACAPVAPVPSPASPAITPSPSIAATAAADPCATEKPGRLELVITAPGATAETAVRVEDLTGDLLSLREMTTEELEAATSFEDSNADVRSVGDDVLVWWLGAPCEASAEIVLGQDGQGLAIALGSRPGCDARIQLWGVVLQMESPVDTTGWTIAFTPSRVR